MTNPNPDAKDRVMPPRPDEAPPAVPHVPVREPAPAAHRDGKPVAAPTGRSMTLEKLDAYYGTTHAVTAIRPVSRRWVISRSMTSLPP